MHSYSLRCSLLILLGLGLAMAAVAQEKSSSHRRARPPKFDESETTGVFFDNIFDRLVGSRPANISEAVAVKPGPDTSTPEPATGGEGSQVWSQLISAASLEDEIKEMKLRVDQAVTTPSAFAGGSHKEARRHFTLLAMLFGIIEQYEGSVRWKESAAVARDRFSRTADNAKAGGASQVYTESQLRKQDLDDLIRGSRLDGEVPENEEGWSQVVDRGQLMQMLEQRFERNLRTWTSNKQEFDDNLEALLREAELVTAASHVLVQPAMPDADLEDYVMYAQQLKQGGRALVAAVKQGDTEAAQQAVGQISKSCLDCHGDFK